MTRIYLDGLRVGDQLPPLVTDPVSRHTLALYCGGSGDHNPIHVDLDFAQEAGHDDVFVHGMYSMAILGRLLSHWLPQNLIKSFGVRFTSITHVHDVITASAEVVERTDQDLKLELITTNQNGTPTLKGHACIQLSS